MDDEEISAWLDSPEVKAELERLEQKDKRAAEKKSVRDAAREAARDERRKNPKSALDAYYNHMENAPNKYSFPKERKAWKAANPSFDFNGVTYTDHWSYELSNSGKTKRWAGHLTGSDGSHIEIMNEHINNRRNDSDRNWGLGRE